MRRFLSRWLRRSFEAAPLACSERDARLNLSFVLHERSDSAAVTAILRERQKRRAPCRADRSPKVIVGNPEMTVDAWLSARVGCWRALPAALAAIAPVAAPVHRIDDAAPNEETTVFFRAPARLSLLDATPRTVGVAILVERPGRRDVQLEVVGPYTWPDESATCLRAIEAMIQRYVDQWQPARALWPAPAEVLLGREVR